MAGVQLATVKATSGLVGSGRATCEVRGQEYRLDAPPLIDGPNEEINPVEALLGPLAACAVLFVQYLARTMKIPVDDVTDADPILSAVRLTYFVKPGTGADRDGIERLVEAFRSRCPVHRTFAKAVSITEEIVLV